MKKLFVIGAMLSTLLILTACGSSPKKNIVGNWKAEVDGEEEGRTLNIQEEDVIVERDGETMSFSYNIVEKDNDQFLFVAKENYAKEISFTGEFKGKNTIILKKDYEGDSIEGEVKLVRLK